MLLDTRIAFINLISVKIMHHFRGLIIFPCPPCVCRLGVLARSRVVDLAHAQSILFDPVSRFFPGFACRSRSLVPWHCPYLSPHLPLPHPFWAFVSGLPHRILLLKSTHPSLAEKREERGRMEQGCQGAELKAKQPKYTVVFVIVHYKLRPVYGYLARMNSGMGYEINY